MPRRKGGAATAAGLRDLEVEPQAERRRQGGVVYEGRYLPDEAKIRRVWQGLDTTGIMLARGSINERMKRAADIFHDHFRRAGFDALHGAADPTRVPVQLAGGGSRWSEHAYGIEASRLQVLTALDALGGVQEPGGSCAWHVLGLEESLKAWAMKASLWGTRRIDHVCASGILIADLAILRRHWGL